VSLRSRLLLALLATSAVSLIVAALALLSPLQQRLQVEARHSLGQAALAFRPQLEDALRKDHGHAAFNVVTVTRVFAQRTGARVALYSIYPAVQSQYDTETTAIREDDVYRAFIELKTIDSSTDQDSRLAVMIYPPGLHPWIMAVRQTDTQTGAVVSEVRDAFLVAALVGLGVALLLGLALSTGLSRRLGRLRRSALALAADGVGAPPPVDTGPDEVGDLARALASMQQALRRQEEARRAFVATASHELRTPLTSLQGNLELLAEDLDQGAVDVDAAQSQLRGAQVQLRRLSNLASELLDLSRLDAGVVLRREPVELGEICRAVTAEFGLRARDRGVDLEIVPPTGPVWAGGDPGAVARVARILLDNALRFAPPHDEIRVSAAYHGDRATLEIADHGPGVPDAERHLIFERFQRGTHTGGEGGFGLGLAIGRELALRMDGTLELATQVEGAGARFVLTLPIELPKGSGAGAGGAETFDDDLGRLGDEAGGTRRL
jgi:signal transduction histidine kinase